MVIRTGSNFGIKVVLTGVLTVLASFGGMASESHKLLINEIMALNESGLKDEDGDFSDWIEIYNPGSEAVDLAGWALTDNPANPGKWKFRPVLLPAGQYLVVFASEKDRNDPAGILHTNFKLSGSGEYLALTEPDQVTVSFSYGETFPAQQKDVSYGLYNGNLVFFTEPTPGKENSPGNQVLAPLFSHAGGYYDTPIRVEIMSPQANTEIYYTTDGTRPDNKTGKRYSQPVEVTTTTPLSAVIFKNDTGRSEIVSNTYLFINDIIRQPTNPEGYPATWGPYALSSGNAPADYEMDPEICNNQAYKNDLRQAFLSIPTLSLVTNPGYIFSHETDARTGGIYIYTGDTNKGNLGEDWERPVSAEYFDPLSKASFQVNCGLQLHGGNSRKPENSQKHSFRISFRSEFGASKLNFNLFNYAGATTSFNSLVLRAGYNYSWIKNNATQRKRADYIRDPFAKNTQLAMGHPSAHNKFVHLFINGLYWGVYNVSEKITDDFMESYMGGKENDWDVVKDHSGIVDGNRNAWTRLISQTNAGFSSNAAYQKVQGMNADGSVNSQYENLLDVDNLIDYMIYNIYIGNNDWDHNNWIAGRNRVETAFGFRFFCWDAEDAMTDVNVNMVNENNSGNPSMIYTGLQKNEEFRLRFADHLQKHFFNSGALTAEATAARYRQLASEIDLAIICESARWGDYRKDVAPSDADRLLYTRNNHWLPEVNARLNDYFPYRSAIVMKQFRSAGLFPEVDAPVFSPHGGETGSPVELSMHTSSGEIYFTTDNSDPRLSGGAIRLSSAVLYKNPLTVQGSGTIKARTKLGNSWSALTEAAFVSQQPGGIVVSVPGVPSSLKVQAYPNPLTRFTNIEFRVPETSFVKAEICRADGQTLCVLKNGTVPAGSHRVTWYPSGNSGGIYFYRVQLNDRVFTGKLLLIN